jgi:chromosome segregation ATPase
MRCTIALIGLALVLPLAALAQQAPGTGKSLYRWVDAEGHVHYSDAVPSDAAKNERQVIDEHGDVRHVLPRQKSEAEQAEDTRREKAAQQQADYDKSLLKTYLTVEDLKKAGNERIDTIDGHIEQAQKQVSETQDKITDMRAHIAAAQAGGQAVDPDLQKQLDNYDATLQQNREQLAQLKQDRQHAEDQYIRDVERYKQLQAGIGITNK